MENQTIEIQTLLLGVNLNFFDCKNMKIDHFAISGTNLGEAT